MAGYVAGDNQYFNSIQERYLAQTSLTSAASCAQILEALPDSQSGYYWVGTIRTYCDFNVQTPSNQRAWERIANLDMSNPDARCPSEYRLVKPPETRGRFCVMTMDSGCQTHLIPVGTTEISRVYGRINGVQISSGDGFNADRNNIDNFYLDGISLTVGSPRMHIWSFVNYALESEPGCPCSLGSTVQIPDFVGSDYFCEAGTFDADFTQRPVFENDLLWDGEQCGGLEGDCCMGTVNGTSIASPPWFYKEFNSPQRENNIELRLCHNQDMFDEDIGLHLVELYVQ